MQDERATTDTSRLLFSGGESQISQPKDWLTRPDAAAVPHVSVRCVDSWLASGELPFYRLGTDPKRSSRGRILIRRRDLDHFLERFRHNPPTGGGVT